MIWIGYTTRYREGGPLFERAAHTLAEERRAARPEVPLRLEAVETERDFRAAVTRLADEGELLRELHLLGHSGMYGPMFGTRARMEQLSPDAWRTLPLRFAPDGEAFFRSCRSARWFAPFFARAFGVPTHGYFWYTSFSTRREHLRAPAPDERGPVFVHGAPGRTSHGVWGSLGKYSGRISVEPLGRFEPGALVEAALFDALATERDRLFEEETRVLGWLRAHLPPRPVRLLDVGCGDGTLLRRLAPRLEAGAGVDRSPRRLAEARRTAHPRFHFALLDGTALPFPDAGFDVVVACDSFRHLDWDSAMNEMRRVLAPGGRILLVERATAPLSLWQLARRLTGRAEACDLPRLAWNPLRAEPELRAYLRRRFPASTIETLAAGATVRLLGFDSGPLQPGRVAPLTYP